MNTRPALALLAISVALAACSRTPTPESTTTANGGVVAQALAQQLSEHEFVQGEVLVQYKPGASENDKARADNKGGVQRVELVRADRGRGDLHRARIAGGKAVVQAIADLQSDPSVEFAEPNWIYHTDATPTDPYYTNGSLWGMYGPNTSPANQFGSNAGAAWAAGQTGSSDVYVGVIDEGIQYTHPDLNGQVWTNTADPVNGVDDDGDGYVDDVHGWDFANNDNSIYDGGTNGRLDDHGTHVSGTIAGKANNGGVVGLNWNVTLVSAKFLGRNGGTTANAVKAVDYLTTLKQKGLNVVASNNSWGGGGFSQALYDAISRADGANILFIAAAGNGGSDGIGDNNDTVANYPSNYDLPNVIAVAAIDSKGGLASFSNYGKTTVDIGAPGVAINSSTAYNTYSSYSGTSMATPHVTGAVALYASTHSGATAAQIKNAILSSAVATTSLSGKTVTGGRLDANAALSK